MDLDLKGLYVGGIGGFGSGAYSGIVTPGLFGAVNISLVWDDDGNKGWAVCGSGGIAAGTGVIGGLSVTNAWGADTICDLEGTGVGAGVGGAGAAGAWGWGGFVEGSLGGVTTGVGFGIGGWAVAVGVGGCKVFPLYPGAGLGCRDDNNKCEQ